MGRCTIIVMGKPVSRDGGVVFKQPKQPAQAAGQNPPTQAVKPIGEKDSPMTAVAKVGNELGKYGVFKDGFWTLGHGTTKENADKIMKHGLGSRVPATGFTTRVIENTDDGMRKLLDWEHWHNEVIVVVMIPKSAGESPGDYSLGKGVWEWNVRGLLRSQTHRLPPECIRGYFDPASMKFVPNPKFDEASMVSQSD